MCDRSRLRPSALSYGPLEDPEYIDDLIENFREEKCRMPYRHDELLRWHYAKMDTILKGVGLSVD